MFGCKQDATAQLNLGQLTNLKKKKRKKTVIVSILVADGLSGEVS